jgi:hypothetical protein
MPKEQFLSNIMERTRYIQLEDNDKLSVGSQKLEAQWAEPVSLTFHSALRKLNTEPSIGASHQISVHLAKRLQRRGFLEINQSETTMACGGHVY